ncbi:hypothetical protein BGZ76_006204 [Entomortierella beljakovae]|nr:hypothetical protein BGZ76_006204 [Entomortierella beljakovae]
MKHIGSQSELNEQLAAAGSKLVVVDFFATWCPPCKMLAPVLETLEKKYRSTVFAKVDVDDAQECSKNYDVTAMPTIIFFKNNSEVARVVGADVNSIQNLITKHGEVFSGEGQTLGGTATASSGSGSSIPSTTSSITENVEGPGGSCQIQVRLLDGSAIRGNFEPSHTVRQVHDFVKANFSARNVIVENFSLMTNFPKVIYDDSKLDQTLQDANLTPRAQLIVKA